MKIPQDIVDKIRESSDIVEVIGEFVSLKKRGRNFLGLCPFHKEKTPSFVVSPDKGIYKCFGCSKAGNVFTFVSDYHGLNFSESLKLLAHKYSIDIPETKYSDAPEKTSITETAYEAMNEAALFFHKLLRKKEGATALRYFHKRGFKDDIIDKFLLGYSPEEWDTLTKKLIKHGFEENLLVDIGISIRSEKGHIYDRFRSRAIFTVRDFMGRVVGFGARLMIDDKSQPKYINSPQSIVYDKSKLLFGIFEAKNSIRDKKFAIMVEGYADYLTLFRSGIENVVASSGTSLTNEQLSLLKRYTKSICFAYDGDEAGRNAAVRGAEMALAAGFDTSITRLPANTDPDSVISELGFVQMEYFIRDAETYISYRHKNALEADLLKTPAQLTDFVRSTIKTIVSIPDSLQHDFYIRQLSQLLNLTENQLRQVYKFRAQSINNIIQSESQGKQTQEPADYLHSDEAQTVINYEDIIINRESLYNEEKLILNFALQGIDEFTDLIEKYDVGPETFITSSAKAIFSIIQSHSDKEDIMNEIFNDLSISSSVKSFVAELAIMKESPSEAWYKKFQADELKIDYETAIIDSRNKLKSKVIENQLKEIQNMLKSDHDNETLLKRFIELRSKKREVDELIYKN